MCWSAPLLFAFNKIRFSSDKAGLIMGIKRKLIQLNHPTTKKTPKLLLTLRGCLINNTPTKLSNAQPLVIFLKKNNCHIYFPRD